MRLVSEALVRARNLLAGHSLRKEQSRTIYWLLYGAGNKLDAERIKQVGPDRACAEWLLKCGARVKFHGRPPIGDYSQLSMVTGTNLKLAEVEAEEATIMSMGFAHLDGVTQLQKMSFKKCTRFDDGCLAQLSTHVSESLQDLQISSCGDVSDRGLQEIQNFKQLKTLRLFELPAVKKKSIAFQELQKHLPKCYIEFEDEDFNMCTRQ